MKRIIFFVGFIFSALTLLFVYANFLNSESRYKKLDFEFNRVLKVINENIKLDTHLINNNQVYYNPTIRNSRNEKLNNIIDNVTIVYRISEKSCSACVERNLDSLVDVSKNSKTSVVVLCEKDAISGLLRRQYEKEGIEVYTILEFGVDKKIAHEYPSIFFVVNNECAVLDCFTEKYFDLKLNLEFGNLE